MALPAERYARAEQLLECNVRRRVRNVTVAPHWLPGGDQLWYERAERNGSRYILVDPDQGTTRELDQPPAAPPSSAPAAPGRLRSPDGQRELRLRDGNLFVAPAGGDQVTALTHDAVPDYDYATSPGSSTTLITRLRGGEPLPPVAVWAPDSSRVLTHRLDQRQVGRLPLVESVPPDGGRRPRLYSLPMPLAGDAHLPTAELLILDTATGTQTRLQTDPLLVEFLSPLELGWAWWDDTSARVYFLREARGAKRLQLCVADAGTGAVRVLIDEAAGSYVEPSALLPWPSFARVVPGRDELVWPSERDGWWHLYLFDGAGQLVRQLTRGEWVVREVLRVDAETVYCVGSGREPDRDPYARYVYRVPLAGGEPTLLTPEDADHTVTFAPSGRYFLDTASRVDTAPVTRLRRADSSLVLTLETADLSDLQASGWRPPERFRVKAADGTTDLYGLLYYPSDFDPARRYPVIDHIYPGPQLIRTPQSFAVDNTVIPYNWPGLWPAQSLAELGFVVLNVDGRGTPLRSGAFHRASYGHLEAYALDDHIAALRALVADRPYLDLTRVGIVGHSAGAAAACRAILAYPDFFKVAVSASGVHDLQRYLAYWGEKYQGLVGEADYAHQSNLTLADRLEGKLLLMHGELDDNVHPANTLALVDALIKADKDFDLLILPGQNHACADHPYYVRRVWDYVVRHLLGEEPPRGFHIAASP